MKKGSSSTVLLIIALAGLSAWYFLYEKHFKLDKSRAEEKAKLIVPYLKEEIQELEILHSKGETVKLQKSGADWILLAPINDLADSGTIASLLTTLTSAQEERKVEDNPSDLTPYGLSEPLLKIRVKKDLNSSLELWIGAQTEVGFSSYAKLSDRSPIYKINRSLPSAFEKSVFELRNKKLVMIPKEELKEVEIQNSSGSFLVNKEENGKWFLAREGMPTDSASWGRLLTSIVDLRTIGVISEKTDNLAPFGLNRPTIQIGITPFKKPKQQILIGLVSGKVYAKNEEKPFVYELDKTVLKELQKAALDLREKHLVTFDRFSVSKIRFSGINSLEIKKDGAGWIFSDAAKEERIDPSQVEQWLTHLQDVNVNKYLGPTSKTNLKSTSLKLELYESKDQKESLAAELELNPHSAEVTGKSNYLPLAWTITLENWKLLNLQRKDFLEKPASQIQEKPLENNNPEKKS